MNIDTLSYVNSDFLLDFTCIVGEITLRPSMAILSRKPELLVYHVFFLDEMDTLHVRHLYQGFASRIIDNYNY